MSTLEGLLAEASAVGLRLAADGDRLLLSAPAPPPPALIDRLKAAKPAILVHLRQPPIPPPLVMRDGRRRWSLPPAGDPDADVAELVARARDAKAVLVADGRTLHVTAPKGWPASELLALARHSAAVVQALHRASDARLVAGQHQGAAYTGPDGRAVTLGPGEPVPLVEIDGRPSRRPELRVVTSADRQANVERMIAAGDIGEDLERQAIQEIDGGESPW